MIRNLILAPALAALALAAAAQAQTAPAPQGAPAQRSEVSPNGRIAMHVGALVLEDLKQFIPDDTRRGGIYMRMLLLAKQEAIGASCAAYTLDQKRMAATMIRTMRPISEGVSKDVGNANLARALRQYHTLLGGELAQYAYDPSGYCGSARQVFDDLGAYPAEQSVLVLKPA